MWKRDLIAKIEIMRAEYNILWEKYITQYERSVAVCNERDEQRDRLKGELLIATQKCNAGYSEIQHLSQQLESCRRVAAEELVKRDKEIALLKYHAANPTFGSTHTPAVQEKKGKRK